MKAHFFLALFFLLVIGYVVFSYSLTAPNLILSSWPPYWQFQTWMWQNLFNNRALLSQVFTLIISAMWLSYAALMVWGKKWLTGLSRAGATAVVLLISLPLVVASSALSYDIFNYLFNAKMVVVYQVDPHHSVALDFNYDDWVRFMHNTHTPAPYGYGWTALSLVPYTLGLGKLLSTWLSFKTFSWLAYFLLAVMYWHHTDPKNRWYVWLILLNPLMLIELIGNAHNDLWMLVPALAALLLVRQNTTVAKAAASMALLALSVSIKLASIVVVPLWLVLVVGPTLKKSLSSVPLVKHGIALVQDQWAWLASAGLFLPLFTERSKYFLPWYISWSLVWLPFLVVPKNKFFAQLQQLWVAVLLGFSVSSLYRYLPFLSQGDYSGSVPADQIAITWVGGTAVSIVLATFFFFTSKSKK